MAHCPKRIYVRAEFPHINDDYKNYLLQKYEATYYPERIIAAGKAAYVERNQEMIDASAVCVVYYDPDYALPCRNAGSGHPKKSGTDLAYSYAVRKGKKVINIADFVTR